MVFKFEISCFVQILRGYPLCWYFVKFVAVMSNFSFDYPFLWHNLEFIINCGIFFGQDNDFQLADVFPPFEIFAVCNIEKCKHLH